MIFQITKEYYFLIGFLHTIYKIVANGGYCFVIGNRDHFTANVSTIG